MREFRLEPRPYELMVLIHPEVTDEALTAQIDRVSEIVTSHGGEVTNTKRDTPWGRRRLAYPIDGVRDATYVLYHFKSPAPAIHEIERDLKLEERVIRYLLIRHEEPAAPAETPEQPPSPAPTS